MKTADFFFDLPPHLIARYPAAQRDQSRLMILNRITGKRIHRMVEDLPVILCGPDFQGKNGGPPLLVFNNSKVRKARLIGTSLQTGAKAEFLLLEKVVPYPQSQDPVPQSPIWKALVQRAKRRKPGSVYGFYDAVGGIAARATITDGELAAQAAAPTAKEFRFLEFDRPIDDDWFDKYGHVPLPPYIKREDSPEDADRYQTVYAAAYGSCAAPTAGLHFTRELLDRLAAAGIETAFITLHVGLGTFLPVRSENIEDHVMHEESFYIDEVTAAKIEKAKNEGRKIIAVGTTSVRTLENTLKKGEGSTSIFIYPSYQFKAVDALFTNFHTPESTLLMLVSAFAESNQTGKNGRELILESYAEAIQEEYRFFSYGDAMLIV